MRMITKSVVALGFVGALAGATVTTSSAQGIYLQGPGFDVGIGQPAYRERYYPGYYDYNYSGPAVYSERRTYGCCSGTTHLPETLPELGLSCVAHFDRHAKKKHEAA
jgi:hypothetical protein